MEVLMGRVSLTFAVSWPTPSFHHNDATDQVNGSFQLVALPLFLVNQLLVVVRQAEGLGEKVLVRRCVDALGMRKRQQENLQILG